MSIFIRDHRSSQCHTEQSQPTGRNRNCDVGIYHVLQVIYTRIHSWMITQLSVPPDKPRLRQMLRCAFEFGSLFRSALHTSMYAVRSVVRSLFRSTSHISPPHYCKADSCVHTVFDPIPSFRFYFRSEQRIGLLIHPDIAKSDGVESDLIIQWAES